MSGAASLESVNINDEKISGYSWTLDGTIATYGSASKTLLTAGGVKSLDGISLSGKVVTVSKAALNAADISVSGVKSLDGLNLNKKVVTVSASSLGTNDVTISDGYKLKLGSDVSKPSTSKAWTFKNSTATYKQTTKAGYTLEDNVIRYSKKKPAATLATIKGVENVDGLSISGKMITAEATALSKKVTVSSDDYGFDFGADYKKAKISGSEFDDKIKSAGQRVTLFGGAGDDSLVGSGKYSSLSGGAGNDTITDYESGVDTVMIMSGTVSNPIVDGRDVYFSVGDRQITFEDTASKSIVPVNRSGKQVGQYIPK